MPCGACSSRRPRRGRPALTLTPSFDRVTPDWNAPSGGGVMGYRVWRGLTAGELTVLVSDTGSTSTTYVDEAVEAETAYHYAVAAPNANGAGPQSTSSIATLRARRIINVTPPVAEEPLVAAQQQSFNDNPIVTFAANLGGDDTLVHDVRTDNPSFQQSFTTGPGGSGFLLHSFSFRAYSANDTTIVSLWTDEGGSPGEKLAELGRIGEAGSVQDLTLEHLDQVLFPATTYWVRFEVRDKVYELLDKLALTRFVRSSATGLDAGSLPGWSFGGDVKFALKGRVVPLTSNADGTPSDEVLVSSLQGHERLDHGVQARVEPDEFHAQRFKTGSHPLGYDVASVQFQVAQSQGHMVVTVHGDSNNRPADAALFTFSGPPVAATSYTEYTFTPPPGARLEPDTNYWLKLTASTGIVNLPETRVASVPQIDSGWNIASKRYFRPAPTGSWFLSSYTALMFTLSGSCPAPTQVECADLPTFEATPGRVPG